jgi:hypothetical protein
VTDIYELLRVFPADFMLLRRIAERVVLECESDLLTFETLRKSRGELCGVNHSLLELSETVTQMNGLHSTKRIPSAILADGVKSDQKIWSKIVVTNCSSTTVVTRPTFSAARNRPRKSASHDDNPAFSDT